MVLINLTEIQIQEAQDVALMRENYWKEKGFGKQNWGPNQLSGALGEIALRDWFREQGLEVDAAFKDMSRQIEADLYILVEGERWGIDVKTADQKRNSHRLAETQVINLKNKADIVVWCNETHCDDFDVETWDSKIEWCQVEILD